MAKPPSKTELGDDNLADALAKLSPEEADIFLAALELTLKRRRLLLVGYIAAVLALIGGMVTAFYLYGTREPGSFAGWVFLVPFAAVAIILMTFGRMAKSSKGSLKTSKSTATKKS